MHFLGGIKILLRKTCIKNCIKFQTKTHVAGTHVTTMVFAREMETTILLVLAQTIIKGVGVKVGKCLRKFYCNPSLRMILILKGQALWELENSEIETFHIFAFVRELVTMVSDFASSCTEGNSLWR